MTIMAKGGIALSTSVCCDLKRLLCGVRRAGNARVWYCCSIGQFCTVRIESLSAFCGNLESAIENSAFSGDVKSLPSSLYGIRALRSNPCFQNEAPRRIPVLVGFTED